MMAKKVETLSHGPLKETAERRYRRFPLITRVTQYDGQTTYWRAVNISEGGIFVRAAPALPAGTETEISFYLPTSEVEVVVQALVVWNNSEGQPDYDASKPYGMGMKFVRLKPEFQRLIGEYVESRATGEKEPGDER